MRDKVENSPFLERDKHSRAIVNTDSNALKGYRIQREKMLKFNRIEGLENDVASLKNDINDIKTMLIELINNK